MKNSGEAEIQCNDQLHSSTRKLTTNSHHVIPEFPVGEISGIYQRL